ncbi:MAG: hypothetical protein Q9219_000894 [cf. Caloplaca sp. 3 TL-2023]
MAPVSSSIEAIFPQEEAIHQWRRQFDHLYNFQNEGSDHGKPDENRSAAAEAHDTPEEQVFQFRLFSNKSRQSEGSNLHPPTIRITSPEPVSREPGFVRPGRPEDHYFTNHTEVDRKRYEVVAVDGDDIVREAGLKWPLDTIGKRRRSGKKRRIAIRIRAQAQKDKEEKLKQAIAGKENLEREKRNRRNREKKVKRREKARTMKKGEKAESVNQ